ncbi:uncharacterized protein LOC112180033 [Rosa chinensis]|uniref:uncharacterized protein LOC112180033 n=1 Tax=Rosa chinensis TaxID=74649 RepID=UPI000D0966B3|nr:uncharacterized protein LOC112180033 [Rosa chinensis]
MESGFDRPSDFLVWQIEDFVQLRLMCLGISYSHPVISPSRISSLLFFFIPQLLKSGSRFSRNIGKVEAWNLIGCDLFAVGQIEVSFLSLSSLCLGFDILN